MAFRRCSIRVRSGWRGFNHRLWRDLWAGRRIWLRENHPRADGAATHRTHLRQIQLRWTGFNNLIQEANATCTQTDANHFSKSTFIDDSALKDRQDLR